ncbi:hypothetical protein [Oceanobacter mangrovi]|uniref:hypothetical protein n=1 Tax=Oceanobacter mangrovi TaxID=2862510 RepID=UPI001C8D4E2E|nr:hypothetical protein [Oceanobacter mangrovi]
MGECYKSGDFKKYFDENMKALGLPVPGTLFDTYNSAIATMSTMSGTLSQHGKGATMAELIGATTGLEQLAVAASIGASAYTGAAIGSLSVAAGRSLGCGSQISDLFVFVERNGLEFPGWKTFYSLNPEILGTQVTYQGSFAMKARNVPNSFEYA